MHTFYLVQDIFNLSIINDTLYSGKFNSLIFYVTVVSEENCSLINRLLLVSQSGIENQCIGISVSLVHEKGWNWQITNIYTYIWRRKCTILINWHRYNDTTYRQSIVPVQGK